MITALLIPAKDGKPEVRFQFSTSLPTKEIIEDVNAAKDIIVVQIYVCDDKWTPMKEFQRTIDKRTEEVYHRELRASSQEKGHFVKEYSTNPELNPEYDTKDN